LARDIGKELKVGGYLADLERTRVGKFRKEQSLEIMSKHKIISET
jgi:tRNA U55 pseudouridine synthase TruB